MPIHELRDPTDARTFLLQSLWLQRVQTPRASTVGPALEWAHELAGAGEPLPPLGLIADVGHIVFQAATILGQDLPHIHGWPEGLARTYEDYVLGKLLADSSIERAGDALRHYQGRDRVRGLTFLLTQLRQRASFGGVHLSPAIIKVMRDRPAEEVLAEGWQSLDQNGTDPLLPTLYEELIGQIRHTASLLGPEDVFELESRTALAPFAQRVALRQVLQATAALESALPHHKMRPSTRRHEVPTRVLDEDVYPVGGFSSIANRGSIESLLHSQLAYMESDRPDLFDMKYLRDELLFYARDENQFLRRRRTYVFAFYPDLVQARFKDIKLPWQRIVLLLAITLAAMRKLIDWLSTDALVFEFLFIEEKDTHPLAAEKALLEMILREQIANGTAVIGSMRKQQLAPHLEQRSRRSLCNALTLAVTNQSIDAEGAEIARLISANQRPELRLEDDEPDDGNEELPLMYWSAVVERLLRHWM